MRMTSAVGLMRCRSVSPTHWYAPAISGPPGAAAGRPGAAADAWPVTANESKKRSASWEPLYRVEPSEFFWVCSLGVPGSSTLKRPAGEVNFLNPKVVSAGATSPSARPATTARPVVMRNIVRSFPALLGMMTAHPLGGSGGPGRWVFG